MADLDWITVRRMEGSTLYTRARQCPFVLVEVSNTGIAIKTQHGKTRTYSRENTVEPAYRLRCEGLEVNAKNLNRAGISKKKSGFSYLPAIIEAIYEKSRS